MSERDELLFLNALYNCHYWAGYEITRTFYGSSSAYFHDELDYSLAQTDLEADLTLRKARLHLRMYDVWARLRDDTSKSARGRSNILASELGLLVPKR